MALGGLFEAFAKLPKYDVFIAHSEEDEPVVSQLIEFFQENGITYTTPEDYWKSKEYISTMVYPSPIRNSYFFLLIDEQKNLNRGTIQDWLWSAAILNKSHLVLNSSEEPTVRSNNAYYFNALDKRDQLMELVCRIQTEPRDPDWIYGKSGKRR